MAGNAKKSTDDVEKSGVAEKQETSTEETKSTTSETKNQDNQSTINDTDSSEKSETSEVAQVNESETAENNERETAETSKAETTEAKSDSTDASDSKQPDDEKTNIAISIELPDEKSNANTNDDQEESFYSSVREQIENCKFEIIAAVQESTHKEVGDLMNKQMRKLRRRHFAGSLIRDLLILILAALVGYLSYCLYDVKYFDFMKSDCERNNTCVSTNTPEPAKPEIVKDTAWYVKNYGSLLDNLKVHLDASKIDAYYLYSNDLKVSEIQPNYLLAMAYNRLDASTTYDSERGISIPSEDLRKAFISLFGSADYYARRDFTNGCGEFKYNQDLDSFVAPTIQCANLSQREIIEEVTEAHEEGNVLYFLTVAAIYDKAEQSFYTFDSLFKPAFSNVEKSDLAKHQGSLNQYQYRFKKVDGNYYFSDVTKLK